MSLLNLESLKSKKNIKKIFFYRVCGTGMGAAACLLKEKGFHVEGGDLNFYPPMSTYLEKSQIKLHKLEDLNENFFKEFDLIVVGNVVPKGGEAALMIEGLGVSYASFPCALGALILSNINVVGIAGTHGKTTTTYFMSQVFKKLGEDPGHFIGGVIDGMASARLGNGKYFFIESDEYDSAYFEKFSKFRQYFLDHLILTSLEFDHADIFDSIEDIKDEFRAILKDFNGNIIADSSYEHTKSLLSENDTNNNRIIFYGDKASPKILKEDKNGSIFELVVSGEKETFETNIIGLHNILNISSVILFAASEKYPLSAIKLAVRKLLLVKRRQEIRGLYGEAVVIDDFAHHPRAVEMTINATKARFPNKKICVVMEPNSATARSSLFQKEFEASLCNSNHLLFARPSRDSSIKGTINLNGDKIVENLRLKGITGKVVGELDELLNELKTFNTDNDVILILSNGTCLGLWESKFVEELHIL